VTAARSEVLGITPEIAHGSFHKKQTRQQISANGKTDMPLKSFRVRVDNINGMDGSQ
jgi:hypothetical protein